MTNVLRDYVNDVMLPVFSPETTEQQIVRLTREHIREQRRVEELERAHSVDCGVLNNPENWRDR